MIAVLLALALLAWLLTPKATKAPGGASPTAGPCPWWPPPARAGDMPITLIGLGSVTPIATVTVQSQVAGAITKVLFKEGQNVKPGDPLFQIDPRPFQVALEQAQGTLARDKALLANARTDLERYTTLFAQDSIAEQTLATQKSQVLQDEGTVKTDEAQVDTARLNLSYAHVVSPIAGRAGLQQVNLGNYVTPAEPNGLVVIAQLQPITVVFSLPEDQIPPLLAQLHAGNTLTVTAFDRTNTTQLATGTLQSIDSQIDATTGTLKMKAGFANAEESLFPQQFVNVVLLLEHAARGDARPPGRRTARRPGHLRIRGQGRHGERAQGDVGSGQCHRHLHPGRTEARGERGDRRGGQAQGGRQGPGARGPSARRGAPAATPPAAGKGSRAAPAPQRRRQPALRITAARRPPSRDGG